MLNTQSHSVLNAISHFSTHTPHKIALQGKVAESLTYGELVTSIELVTYRLNTASTKVLGLAMDNSPAWAIADLVAMELNLPVVPLPYFFSSEQTIHAIEDAGVNVVLSDQPILLKQVLDECGKNILQEKQYLIGDKVITEFILEIKTFHDLPKGIAKITYTSGTTGKPKGVCLDLLTLNRVALSLLNATKAMPTDRHLSILPLSTLLENIAGLYVPLLAGATAILMPSALVGLSGATGLNIANMMEALSASRATTTVLTPELLNALVSAIEVGYTKPHHLRFLAVGGASVSPQLLNRAAAINLPVYEGYGLSECASVVALNTHLDRKIGSVGKPLPHISIKLSEYGEILVKGACLLGYVSDLSNERSNLQQSTEYFATGDIGHLDEDGYLYITARKKNQFITSFGRNVAPEWVERELTVSPFIAQAAVFGEAKPWNVAIIVPAKNATSADIDIAIAEINQSLPDYARVSQWLSADAPFTPQNNQLTANGRLRRIAIWQHYQERIDEIYKEKSYAVL
ncbi:MAG: AMP-binding protein [Methylotenera sp.]|uniref:AMP-binding protein n=1 Tax=Methylotenera sp. TaxID=2051956 RepID=UPI002487E5E7|nr:AMP-binding protein [Methylotenera sp.]MDI1308375.1 AMP-binding protein [Methylotenera sp.]